MATLEQFEAFVEDCQRVLAGLEDQLCDLQAKYETFFAEIERTREVELGQLKDAILADRTQVPGDIAKQLEQAVSGQTELFDQKIAALEEQLAQLVSEAEQIREASAEHEQRVRRENRTLDDQEEGLKARNAKLLDGIADFNQRIRQLGRGFGFFWNLFRMRSLAAERRGLDREQSDVLAQIEGLRSKWAETDTQFAQQEQERKQTWLETSTQAAALQAKIESLQMARSRMIERGAFEQVLFARAPALAPIQPGDPACSRCGQPNPADRHFCHICALRLVADRPDLGGSLLEIAELNLHHARFSDGMRACQEIIGLVRGLKTGLERFEQSVADMRSSQRKHKLKILQIDVPGESIAYAAHFERLREMVCAKGSHLHPTDFAAQIQVFVQEVFSEERIKAFFEGMGEELSRQADAQW
jgi:hypothetical protein